MEKDKIGILFRKADYVGAPIRVLIDLIDFLVIGLSGLAVLFTGSYAIRNDRVMGAVLFFWLLLALFYLGPWKSTNYPTLGYLVFRVRLVDSRGNRADFWQASGRALFMLIGPANYLIDLFWLYGETPRQALRDKFTGT